jgi:hypothetical protein
LGDLTYDGEHSQSKGSPNRDQDYNFTSKGAKHLQNEAKQEMREDNYEDDPVEEGLEHEESYEYDDEE